MVDIITKFIKGLILLAPLMLISCGDSPFLNDDKKPNGTTQFNTGLQSELILPLTHLRLNSYWRVSPNIGGESKLLTVVTDENGTPADVPGELRLKLWMPTMGHGSFPITVRRISVGVYESSEIFFTMGGYWDIHFQSFNNEELIEEEKWGLDL